MKPLADAEGWLHTGDLARTGEDGYLYFQGRQKDVIVTAAGVNIHPEDLEAAVNRQEGIRTSAVIGVEGRQGPEPVAVLLLRDPSGDAAAAAAKANRELGAHQQIRHWLIWPEADFPRTPTQKVRKPALVEWIRSQAQRLGPMPQAPQHQVNCQLWPHYSARSARKSQRCWTLHCGWIQT
jgi:long-chain acyl-CoA synthetase